MTKLSLLAFSIYFLFGCSSDQVTLTKPVNKKLNGQLTDYNNQLIKELSATWRLYKRAYEPDEEPTLVNSIFKDDYIVIKENYTFATRKGKGTVLFLYSNLNNPFETSNVVLSTIATYDERPFWTSKQRYLKFYIISINSQSKVRELQMTDFEDGEISIYREE